MLKKELQNLGLNEKEAQVYLAALELGETNISRLAKKAGIKRTTTYLMIDSLKEKGLISTIKKGPKTLFFAEDPRTLESLLEEKKKRLENAMPELLAITNLIDKKPTIRSFEGKEGIKQIYEDMLKVPGKEIVAWFSGEYADNVDEEFFDNYFFPKRVEKRISARTILPKNKKTQRLFDKAQEELRQVKFLPEDKYNMRMEISVYGNRKVALISFKEEFGLIIESEMIHESLKNMFEIMWETK